MGLRGTHDRPMKIRRSAAVRRHQRLISLQLEKPLRSFLPCSKLITVQCSETERIMERGRWGVWGFWLEKEGSECGGEGGVTCMEKDGRDSTNLSRWGEKESLGWLEAAFSHRHSQI
ncbi:hypothetical protein BHE74_00015959 [Ensete ventricosum]|nr:hypothetical protein BHE74_00015959 [Ensete ventricosum]